LKELTQEARGSGIEGHKKTGRRDKERGVFIGVRRGKRGKGFVCKDTSCPKRKVSDYKRR